MTSLIVLLALATPIVQATPQKQGDLIVTTLNLPEGKMTIYLPGDMAAGDTVSGTVVAEPAGSGQAALRNDAVLRGMVVEVGDQKSEQADSGQFVLRVPPSIESFEVRIASEERPRAKFRFVPLNPAYVLQKAELEGFSIVDYPSVVLRVQGPFNGVHTNTKATCDGQALVPLAESPRSCVFANVPQKTGPVRVQVTEGDVTTEHSTNIVRVRLESSKPTLLAGERGTLKMTVTGLEGLSDDEWPIPCSIVNRSPGVVRLEGEMAWDNLTNKKWDSPAMEEVAFYFNKVDYKPGTGASASFNLVGVQPGVFLISGVCFGVAIHDAKKLMNARAFSAWVRAMVTAYEEKIKKLEAEYRESPNRGLELNIQRKRNILNILRGFRNTGNPELDAAKRIVDKALADDAFFAMAAELITIAADMLGYTSIPMPGIGTIVKGLKALAGAAKLQKVLERLADVEKLIEQYEALQNVREKVEKAKQIKDALDKVKEALDQGE